MDDISPSAGSGAVSRGSATPSRPRERFAPRLGLLALVLVAILGTGVYLGARVIGALPDVGKNLHPATPWGAPIALERKANGWLVGHVPPCAQGPVAGMFLWDDHGRPLWELRGEAFPIGDFVVGVVPAGLKVVHRLKTPPLGQVLRLGVFRVAGQPVGITFRVRGLRDGKVRYGGKWITVARFKLTAKCPKTKAAKQSTAATTGATTAP